MLRPKCRLKTAKSPYQLSEGEIDLTKSHNLARKAKNLLSSNLNQLGDIYTDLRYDIYSRAKKHTDKIQDYNSQMKNRIESIMRTEKVYNKRLNAVSYSPKQDYDKLYKSIVINEELHSDGKIPNQPYKNILTGKPKHENSSQLTPRDKNRSVFSNVSDRKRAKKTGYDDDSVQENGFKTGYELENSEMVETSQYNASVTVDEKFQTNKAKNQNTSLNFRQKSKLAEKIRSESVDHSNRINKNTQDYNDYAVNNREKRRFDHKMYRVEMDTKNYKKLSAKYKKLINNLNVVKHSIKTNTKAFEKNTFEKTAQMNHLSLTKSYYTRVVNDKKIEQLSYTPNISTTAETKNNNVYEKEQRTSTFRKVSFGNQPSIKPYYINVLKKKGTDNINTDKIFTGDELQEKLLYLKGDDQRDDEISNQKIQFINKTHTEIKFHTIDSDDHRWDMFKLNIEDKKDVLSYFGEQWIIEDKNGTIGSLKLESNKKFNGIDSSANIIVIVKDYLDKAFSSKHDNLKRGHVSTYSIDEKHKKLLKEPIKHELKKIPLKKSTKLDTLPIDYSSILFNDNASHIKDLNKVDKNFIEIYAGGGGTSPNKQILESFIPDDIGLLTEAMEEDGVLYEATDR